MTSAAQSYRRKSFLKPLLLLLGILLLLEIFWPIKSDTGIQLDATDQVRIAQGKKIYAHNCARCHGIHLEGQPDWRTEGLHGWPAPPHDDSGHTWHHPDAQLIQIVKEGMKGAGDGASNMPAFGKILSDHEVISVLSFIKSQWSPEHQKAQEQTTMDTHALQWQQDKQGK
jgi:mono/diheme cytochrome c family protein